MPTTAGWVVELTGRIFDLQDLEIEFKIGAVHVTHDGGTYFLHTVTLQGLSEEESRTAWERAHDALRYVNAVMEMLSPSFQHVAVDAVRWTEDGAADQRSVFGHLVDEFADIRSRTDEGQPNDRGPDHG